MGVSLYLACDDDPNCCWMIGTALMDDWMRDRVAAEAAGRVEREASHEWTAGLLPIIDIKVADCDTGLAAHMIHVMVSQRRIPM